MNHNPNDPRNSWARLASAARTVREERETSAPYGFATRVVAIAFAQERRVASLFERFALRALGVAALLALSSVALNYEVLSSSPMVAMNAPVAVAIDEADVVAADDAVAIVLDLAD
jgi:hypothetical protein